MKERLKLVGGELIIESQSTRGTTVLARAPVRRRWLNRGAFIIEVGHRDLLETALTRHRRES
jgi:hypothetical protein